MPLKFAVEEIAISEALAAMPDDLSLKGTVAARHFNVNYQRLMAKHNGRPSSSTRGHLVDAYMDDVPITTSVLKVYRKTEQAAKRAILRGALAKERVDNLNVAQMACNEWGLKPGRGKIVQKHGEIYDYQALEDIEADEKEEEIVVNIRAALKAKAEAKRLAFERNLFLRLLRSSTAKDN